MSAFDRGEACREPCDRAGQLTRRAGGFFQPTWHRVLGAFALAATAFALPQEAPLVWLPLDRIEDGTLLLEIRCRVDRVGEISIHCDTTRGNRAFEEIRWTVSPTDQAYTYTFPLPDAPIIRLRLDPLPHGGILHIDRMRIVDHRGREIRHLRRESFFPNHQIAAISAAGEGWDIRSTADAVEPFTMVDRDAPVIPVGMNGRNLLRCLISVGYLAVMLEIVLAAALFATGPAAHGRNLRGPLAFAALIALLAALVGNRGLLRDSLHFALYRPPPAAVH
ncbi:MAG TPA: hypothetical protein VHD32_05445 [Candidatus Didemnitutus sp.]|nr:hypothetical protein [Candidatus Didemnitutus sp.]